MLRLTTNKQGFTLVELLVVMAIAAILMGLVLGPVVQSFNLTRRAQAMVDAQDSARTAMNQISRELGQAMYVYDNGQVPIALPVRVSATTVTDFDLPYAKIDMVLPKISMHCNEPARSEGGRHPDDKSRDYPRDNEAWPPCPVCGADEVEARPKLPLEQDVTIVRYFLGLRYNNPAHADFGWRSPWNKDTPAGEGNQVVLYRVEFSLYDDSLFPKGMSVEERLNDPIFFYRDTLGTPSDPSLQPEPFCDRWQHIARVIGLGKYEDLLIAKRNATTDDIESIKPTITFRTAAIDNDTFAGAYSSDRSFEYPDAVPTVYRATYGYWTPDNRASVYRNDYEKAFSTKYDDNGHLIISRWVYNPGPPESWTETPHFDITEYLNTGAIANMDGSADPVEMAFTIDANRGAVDFALEPPRPSGAVTPPANATSPVCYLDPSAINSEYEQAYREKRVAIRTAPLATFDSALPDQYLPNAHVVPGSEQVVGPDMTPNAPAGKMVRYERVPLALGDPGLNQFKIDYKYGQIYFSPVWDQPLPETGDMIQVYYKIQFNESGDVVRGDYSTKCLINIHMEMRMFDPESGQPHPVDLHDSVKVRNALR